MGVGSSIPEKVNVKINMEREREVRFAVEVKANLERRGTGEKHNLPKSSSGQDAHADNTEYEIGGVNWGSSSHTI